MGVEWRYSDASVDWDELSELYRAAPLGEKSPEDLRESFGNSRYTVFLVDEGRLVGVGRALADGVDCSYLCDIAVLPSHQGRGLGKQIVAKLVELSAGHKKILLYANPGKEPLYHKLGFRRMNTAMAIFADQPAAQASGLVSED